MLTQYPFRKSRDKSCPSCHGRGEVEREIKNEKETLKVLENCRTCGGTGRLMAKKPAKNK